MFENIKVLGHSSIRIQDSVTIYIDPFDITGSPHDADIIFITHGHFDHFSLEDIAKIIKSETQFVLPETMSDKFGGSQFSGCAALYVLPGRNYELSGVCFETVAAYNVGKPFHPKANGWVGYVLALPNGRCYIVGDSDDTPEAHSVSCDIALVPVGGTYTMDAQEAAVLVNHIRPRVAIPTHYGSVVGSAACGADFSRLVDSGVEVRLEIRL